MTDRPVSSEMSLLRYYRYQVSPLLDVGDPWCSFSVKVPMLAGSEASLRHAILALAARHRALRTQSNTIGHVEDTICPQQEIDQILLPKENPLWHVRQSLLLFRDFSCLRPHQWRDFVTQRLLFQEIVSFMPTQQDLTNSAFWLLVKMGKYCRCNTSLVTVLIQITNLQTLQPPSCPGHRSVSPCLWRAS